MLINPMTDFLGWRWRKGGDVEWRSLDIPAPVLYDLSYRDRMGKISVTQEPNLDPSLVFPRQDLRGRC
jgi:hypothetical protein